MESLKAVVEEKNTEIGTLFRYTNQPQHGQIVFTLYMVTLGSIHTPHFGSLWSDSLWRPSLVCPCLQRPAERASSSGLAAGEVSRGGGGGGPGAQGGTTGGTAGQGQFGDSAAGTPLIMVI